MQTNTLKNKSRIQFKKTNNFTFNLEWILYLYIVYKKVSENMVTDIQKIQSLLVLFNYFVNLFY